MNIELHPLYLKALARIQELEDRLNERHKKVNIREFVDDNVDVVVFLEPDDLDEAIVGINHDHTQLVYDYNKIAGIYAFGPDGMGYEEALEFVEFNTVGALPYMGEHQPILIIKKEDLC